MARAKAAKDLNLVLLHLREFRDQRGNQQISLGELGRITAIDGGVLMTNLFMYRREGFADGGWVVATQDPLDVGVFMARDVSGELKRLSREELDQGRSGSPWGAEDGGPTEED